jgi:predicted nucleic acid-binding protein
VWVDFLRRGARSESKGLDRLLEAGEVVVCGPVLAELLAGTARERRAELARLLESLRWAPLGRSQWRRVGEVAAVLRERGESVPLTDIGIAIAAADAACELWSRDADFDRIQVALPGLRRFQG